MLGSYPHLVDDEFP